MVRYLFAACLLAVAFAAPTQSHAQGRAYAPENLSQLSVSDRVRVIEREYSDQSGGRRIPDDQLEFYLDQVNSGWRFSRIRQDIATSLGGGGQAWRPPGSGWTAREVVCTSDSNRYRECRTPFRGRARITEQISDTACREGSTWGQRSGVVWVNRGCRARFGPDLSTGSRVTCESKDNRYHECVGNFRGGARLYRQISDTACVEGRTWGQRGNDAIWVNNGCRAEFIGSGGWQDGGNWGGGGNYSVTCASSNNKYTTCAWDSRYGQPLLIEQQSQNACVEGRSWGYDQRGLWVSNGCRGRFGTR